MKQIKDRDPAALYLLFALLSDFSQRPFAHHGDNAQQGMQTMHS